MDFMFGNQLFELSDETIEEILNNLEESKEANGVESVDAEIYGQCLSAVRDEIDVCIDEAADDLAEKVGELWAKRQTNLAQD